VKPVTNTPAFERQTSRLKRAKERSQLKAAGGNADEAERWRATTVVLAAT